jgi:hypothetical protein
MLRLLQSLFGGAKVGNYPESLVKEAIERAVDGTDPWLRGVSGYRKKLRPSVVKAIDHVVALVDALPPATPVSLDSYSNEPLLQTCFMTRAEMQKVFGRDRDLAAYLKGAGSAVPQVVALLAMEKQESVTLGAELSGEIIIRDVPQATVTFEFRRLLDPAATEAETRRNLMRRAFDHLLSLALRRISAVKTERETLERHRSLLQSKLDLLQRAGWGFDDKGPGERLDIPALEGNLSQIEGHLLELGGDDRMLEVYLDIVSDVLGRPEEHLWSKREIIIVDRMGIRRTETAPDAPELTLDEFCNAEGRSLVMSLIALSGDELRGIAV